jgi:sigma-B regulation protein RsbU (phosphoserine phosphatase)
MDDAAQPGREQFTNDLERILDASRSLHRLILSLLDPATVHRADGSADLADYRRTLRHDLRTPINAIKGYGEMLREDSADGSAETFIADLDKLLGEATLLLDRIDGLVTCSGSDASPPAGAAPVATEIVASTGMVESVLKAVRPVAADEADHEAARPSRILVVDDNASNREVLSRRLQRQGHTVVHAEDGSSALALIEKEAPDLVLLDLMMPGISGYEVLARLKRDPRFRDIPVIMISALSEFDSVVRCIEAGADDYLAKPFNPILLRARVGASLEKKRLRDEVHASLGRLETELDAARALQLGMLPSAYPAWSPEQPVQVYALMDPARQVGGDLYDFFPVTDGVYCFLVGDVSGKGAPAAMFMARTRSLVRMAIELWRRLGADPMTPARIAEAVNRELCQNNRDRMFVTLFLGVLDTKSGALTYVNAGHLSPCVLHASGSIERVDGKPAPPLAVRAGTAYQDRTVSLLPDDTIFLFTDGVTEAMNVAEELYGNDRLDAALCAASALTPEEMVRAIKAQVDIFTGEAPKVDDVTMLALRWQPAEPRFRTSERSGTSATGGEAGSAAPTPLPHATHVVIRNDVAGLAALRTAMERVAAEHGIPEEALFKLKIALDEMVSNVIKYAWTEAGAHEIEIRITVRGDGVEIEIIDDGRMFDPLDAPQREKPLPGQRPRPGGLGVQMTKQLVDGISYARIDNRNHTTLTKLCAVGAGLR